MKKNKIRLLSVITMVVALASVAWPASAIQTPSGCNSNRLNLSITKDKTAVQQGETITYTVTVSNVDASPALACDIDGATVTVTLPAADGTPTGTVVTLATGASYPAGFSSTTIGTVPYVVAVNANVTDVVAQARVTGTLHDAPVDHAAEVIKTIGTAIVTPTPTATQASSSAPRLPNAGIPTLVRQ